MKWHERHTARKKAWGWAIAIAAIASATTASLEGAEGTWSRFVADIAVRQTIVDVRGQVMRPPSPAVTFRLERTLAASGWRTVLTLSSDVRPAILTAAGLTTLENPFIAARMEFDGDGTAPRLYDRLGQPIRGPGAADRQFVATPQDSPANTIDWAAVRDRAATSVIETNTSAWIDDILIDPGKRGDRRAAIERRYGKPDGFVNGLERYVSRDAVALVEVLVNPRTAVPVEINRTEGGSLVARDLYGYDTRRDGLLVRRLMRAERVLAEVPGARSILEVELTNVAAFDGGPR